MGMVKYRVTVDLGSFLRFKDVVRSTRGEIREAFDDWSKFYATFIRKRFIRFSRGGGNWKQLAPATLKRKRKSKYPRRILMETGKMYDTLNPRLLKSTSTVRKKRLGISVTYGSRRRYRGGPMVSSVMGWHDKGKGRLPRRRIFINPDRATLKKMATRMEEAMQRELDK